LKNASVSANQDLPGTILFIKIAGKLSMRKSVTYSYFLVIFLLAGCAVRSGTGKGANTMGQIVWDIDNIKSIGGHKTQVLGAPKVIETDQGKAVEFDGIGNGLIVDSLPLKEAEKFTLEIIFRPDANGAAAQRFLHLQETGSESRILIELRMPDSQSWYLDTYIKTEAGDHTLADPPKPHPAGQWYNATLIYDGEKMRHYVNRVEESSAKLAFDPLGEGKISIGMRINRVHWFKGAIRKIRFTDAVLETAVFMEP
jgi:hypothetical protein